MTGTGGVASYGDLLLTSLVVLAAVCVAAFVVVRLFGRFLATGRTRGAHLLDVVARVPLEPRRSLYVVEVAGKTLLVGTSEMGLSVLSELDGGEVRARTVERPTFAELVKQAWMRRKDRAASVDRASASAEASPASQRPAEAAGRSAASVAERSAASVAEKSAASVAEKSAASMAEKSAASSVGDVSGPSETGRPGTSSSADRTATSATGESVASASDADDSRTREGS